MAAPTAEKVIAQAKKYVRSARYGSPNKFTRWYGFGNQVVAWCAIWVYYVLAACGGKTLLSGLPNKAYVPSYVTWAKKKGYWRTSNPRKGDLVIFDWNKNNAADHIGFVIADLGNGYVQTVEGNTSNTSNGNGGCVQIRTRSKSLIMGYVRLPYSELKPTGNYPDTYPSLPARGYFKKGDTGTNVKRLQKFLNWCIGTKLVVDGEFGSKTLSAVKKFQKTYKLKVDGYFGYESWKKAISIKKTVKKKTDSAVTKPAENKPAKGIDVSAWQGDIDWKKVKADGVTHAIIRAAFRTQGDGVLKTDSTFKENITGAYKAGIKVGVYIYSQAITTKEAEKEAAYLIELIKPYKDKITLPVVFDFEFGGRLNASVVKKLGKTKTTDICEAFCNKVKAAGYVPMVYANYSTLTSYLDKETLHKKYKVWLAHYADKTSYTGMDWWQYTSSGKVKGISDYVDMNHVYK